MPTIIKGRTRNPEVWFSEVEEHILNFTHKFGSLTYKTLCLELNHLGIEVTEAEIREAEEDLKRYFNRPIVGCAQTAKERGII